MNSPFGAGRIDAISEWAEDFTEPEIELAIKYLQSALESRRLRKRHLPEHIRALRKEFNTRLDRLERSL